MKKIIGRKWFPKSNGSRSNGYVLECSKCGGIIFARDNHTLQKVSQTKCSKCPSPTHHILYPTWANMKARCYNTKHEQYSDYGGRGITVCQRWLDSFWNFVDDMGDRPEGHTLDRIKNGKGYSPDNCKWSTWEEQAANRRPHKPRKQKGYSLDKRRGKWVSYACIQGKHKHIGAFDCPLLARLAHEDYMAKHFASDRRYKPNESTLP